MADHLSKMFGVKVKMTANEKGQGRITIPFKSDEELTSIIAYLDKVEQ